MLRIKQALLLSLALISTNLFAVAHVGLHAALPTYSTEPDHIRGYQFYVNYDPDRFHWRQFNVYFDLGFSQFSVAQGSHRAITLYSLAPVIRYTFIRPYVYPYLELSIGPTYLNHTRFSDRNLGMHFAFQDRIGIGILIGQKKALALGVHAVHYSNAHLSQHNSGITIPVVLDLAYCFS